MAETNNATGGDSTTNTTTGVGVTEGGRGTGNTVSNISTITKGGNATSGSGGNLSSANTPDANLENIEEPKTVVAQQGSLLPYPHSALANIKTEASSYRDLIKDVYDEHEKEMAKTTAQDIELSDEMLAARDDAQVRLADELRASLKAQRSMMTRGSAQEGAVTIKLSKAHMHAGVAYQAGDEIKVDEVSAKFIEEAKVGKRADGSTKEDK